MLPLTEEIVRGFVERPCSIWHSSWRICRVWGSPRWESSVLGWAYGMFWESVFGRSFWQEPSGVHGAWDEVDKMRDNGLAKPY